MGSLTRLAVVVLVLLTLGACARPQDAPLAGPPEGPRPSPSPSPSPSGPTPRDETAEYGGDGAPHWAENNGWRQARELTPEEQKAADAAAARLLPALERLRDEKAFTIDAMRATLVAAGYKPDEMQLMLFQAPSWWTEPQPPVGVVFAVRVGRGCVSGDIRPESVQARGHGTYAESGCLEPPAGH